MAELLDQGHRATWSVKIMGCATRVVFYPSTPLSATEYVPVGVDLILLMLVEPGFGDQGFTESQAEEHGVAEAGAAAAEGSAAGAGGRAARV